MRNTLRRRGTWTAAALVVAGGTAVAGGLAWTTPENEMMDGLDGWSVDAVLTVGEQVCGYRAPGILDGIGAYKKSGKHARLLVNHELGNSVGHTYNLANNTFLRGARVSFLDLDRRTREIDDAGLAYDKIYDRYGNLVTHPGQVNEQAPGSSGYDVNGLNRLCSSQLVAKNKYGFLDTIYFTGEESSNGTEWALDVENDALWACPDLGRLAWENLTPLDTGESDKVALLCGDDTAGAPLYLYVGRTQPNSADFLTRNGLKGGQIHVWKSDAGDVDPQTFNGFGSTRVGSFVAINARDVTMAGQVGYDAQGYKDGSTLRGEATGTLGAFAFSRPEDLATSPSKGNRAVFASTGRSQFANGADSWGTLYIVTVDFTDMADIRGTLEILYDGDALTVPDDGIRSPDNLDWAGDGYIYVQEDRSVGGFGATSGKEASIWRVDPDDGAGATRIAIMDRTSVVPAFIAADPAPNDMGNWESSGILDVTKLFVTGRHERLLIADVQAHSISNLTTVAGSPFIPQDLAAGGQLFFLSKDFSNSGSEEN